MAQATQTLGHIGCIGDSGDGCPICAKLDQPGYEQVRAALTRKAHGTPAAGCIHLGDPTGAVADCADGCNGGVRLKVFACDVHGGCTTHKRGAGVSACCRECSDRRTLPAPLSVVPIAPAALGCRHAFNASLIRYRGRLLLAYRDGWKGSNIHVAELADDLTPGRTVRLDGLAHPKARYGREDPRLFIHGGRLHVMYAGVMPDRSSTGVGYTSLQYARLTDDLAVEYVHYPALAGRQSWEKNWGPFSWQGELMAVYSIRPHAIIHLRGDAAHPFAECDVPLPWSGGLLRGGAAPVLVGGEWWCWFHGRVEPGEATPSGPAPVRTYNVGVYCFEDRPPFRPTRITPAPLAWADNATRPADQYASVVFPCGAVLDSGSDGGGRWRVSCGIHDRTAAVYEFDHRQVERGMVRV